MTNILQYKIAHISTFFISAILLLSCATAEKIPEGQLEVKKVLVVSDDIATEHNEATKASVLRAYVRQLPGRINGKKKHLVYDPALTEQSCKDLQRALQNNGYLQATVTATMREKKGAHVAYIMHPGKPYTLRNVWYDIQDAVIDSMLTNDLSIHNRNVAHLYDSQLIPGSTFSVDAMNNERQILTTHLRNRGYYRFDKDFIRFDADSVKGKRLIDLTLHLLPYRSSSDAPAVEHPLYTINSVKYEPADNSNVMLRNNVLKHQTSIKEQLPFNASKVRDTYQRFGRLQAVRYTNIYFTETNDSLPGNLLDCHIQLATSKPNTISFQPEGTNTAGNLGAAASLTYENRNLFRGSETLSLELRGAFEAITGLEGYQNHDYEEYGTQARLTFPRFLSPIMTDAMRYNPSATSELGLSYNLQNRPEFHRRVFSGTWRYRWTSLRHNHSWKLDVLDLNYIHMPWISDTFRKEYLENTTTRNTLLRYNYEDLFIMKIGLGMTFKNNTNAIKWNIETAGNLLHGLASIVDAPKNDNGQNKIFNIAYAQYVKGDIDVSHRIMLTENSEIVFHGGLGIAYPYGNSVVLPFEKRYFSGGANSVRGWSVRGLGPGRFRGTDGRIDFINQTGDIKLDMNVEYRMPLFWKFSGAVFLDAGNIWTIREYKDQPGGQFRFNEFYKQIAAAYGLGVRMNFGYFILRFDMGMKAVNPCYETNKEHYPIIYPKLSRDFCFHFAVGLPF